MSVGGCKRKAGRFSSGSLSSEFSDDEGTPTLALFMILGFVSATDCDSFAENKTREAFQQRHVY